MMMRRGMSEVVEEVMNGKGDGGFWRRVRWDGGRKGWCLKLGEDVVDVIDGDDDGEEEHGDEYGEDDDEDRDGDVD